MLMHKFVPVSMTPYPDEGERLGIEWLRQKKRMKESSLDWAVVARGVLHVFRLSPFKYYMECQLGKMFERLSSLHFFIPVCLVTPVLIHHVGLLSSSVSPDEERASEREAIGIQTEGVRTWSMRRGW